MRIATNDGSWRDLLVPSRRDEWQHSTPKSEVRATAVEFISITRSGSPTDEHVSKPRPASRVTGQSLKIAKPRASSVPPRSKQNDEWAVQRAPARPLHA
jgi:hypothetical protein